MKPIILDGNKCAAAIREQLREIASQLRQQHGLVPRLAVLLLGANPASISYVTAKKKAAAQLGIEATIHSYAASISPAECRDKLLQIQSTCHGMLLQLPLPEAWRQLPQYPQLQGQLLAALPPQKDVDGLTISNQGRLYSGDPTGLKPCTPLAILALLKAYGLAGAAVQGRNVCVIGRSAIVGNPIGHMLAQKPCEAYNLGLGDATVTQCHSRSKDLAAHCQRAAIIIAAAGRPQLVTAEMVQRGAVLLDVGINRVADASRRRGYRLLGDLDYVPLLAKASYISPVPGGVGPMTVTMLLHNTIQAACQQRGLALPPLDWPRIQAQLAAV